MIDKRDVRQVYIVSSDPTIPLDDWPIAIETLLGSIEFVHIVEPNDDRTYTHVFTPALEVPTFKTREDNG